MENSDLSEYTLLVAEDDLHTRLYLKEALKKSGLNVLFAQNGMEAMEIIQKGTRVDLIFMDAMMPSMTGFEATRSIKKINPEIPVVMLTAYVDQDSIKQAVASGCNDYLSKPVDLKVVQTIVKKWLTGNK
ncbi:MAG: response regulator [Mariniphaga sp.]|nr:response regulator [Mariniphaga sp.]MDD4426518.1 response regulator [Mariniphaga sp.]